MMDDNLLSLPFDQYQRYYAIAQVAEVLRGTGRLKTLDVGGFPGIISRFLPDDDTHIVDVEPSDLANYHQGSGTDLPFEDNSFDLVTAVDTYEHVLIKDRDKFLAELFRVSKGFVILIGPFASESVELAESFIFDFSEKILGSDFADSHPLKEHIAYGLPDLDNTLAAFDANGFMHKIFPSGSLYNWLLLNFVKHFLFTIPESDSLHQSIDYYYNKFFYEDDKKYPSYRTMVVGVVPGNEELLTKIEKAYDGSKLAGEGEILYRLEFFSFLVRLFDLGAKRELAEIKKINIDLNEQLHGTGFETTDSESLIDVLKEELAESDRLVKDGDREIEALKSELSQFESMKAKLAKIEANPLYKAFIKRSIR